jgi:hypothetical protein
MPATARTATYSSVENSAPEEGEVRSFNGPRVSLTPAVCHSTAASPARSKALPGAVPGAGSSMRCAFG